MTFEARTLKSEDIFPMSKILSKIGVGKLKSVFDTFNLKSFMKKGEIDVEKVGVSIMFELAGVILDNLSTCEAELYAFLSNVTGASEQELRDASLAEFAELIISIVQKDEFKDFFSVASKLFK